MGQPNIMKWKAHHIVGRHGLMSLNIKDLESHAEALRQQIQSLKALQDELEVTESLIEKMKARSAPGESKSNAKYKDMTVESAILDFFQERDEFVEGWVSALEVTEELIKGGIGLVGDSLRSNVGSTLKALAENGLLVRKNVSKTPQKKYLYSPRVIE